MFVHSHSSLNSLASQHSASLHSLCLLALFTGSFTHFARSLVGWLKFMNVFTLWTCFTRRNAFLVVTRNTPWNPPNASCAHHSKNILHINFNENAFMNPQVFFFFLFVFSRVLRDSTPRFALWSVCHILLFYDFFYSTYPAQMVWWPQIWPPPTRTRLG